MKHKESGEGPGKKSEKIQSKNFTTLEKWCCPTLSIPRQLHYACKNQESFLSLLKKFNTLQIGCKNRSTAALSFHYANLIPLMSTPGIHYRWCSPPNKFVFLIFSLPRFCWLIFLISLKITPNDESLFSPHFSLCLLLHLFMWWDPLY